MGETSEEYLRAVTIGGPQRLGGTVELSDYDPAWPALYAREEEKIHRALADRTLQVEHVGSTSVPGLAAKPVIDIVLVVLDPADEEAYVPDLEEEGYALRIREPDWFEHRLLKGIDPTVNLHVFGLACDEVGRMLAFRDHLRADEPDRELYEQRKRELAAREWDYVQHYADAKSEVVQEILARALGP